jgi:hypothetical protein
MIPARRAVLDRVAAAMLALPAERTARVGIDGVDRALARRLEGAHGRLANRAIAAPGRSPRTAVSMATAIRRAPWADGSICRTKSAGLVQTLRRSSTSPPAQAASRTIWSFRRQSGNPEQPSGGGVEHRGLVDGAGDEPSRPRSRLRQHPPVPRAEALGDIRQPGEHRPRGIGAALKDADVAERVIAAHAHDDRVRMTAHALELVRDLGHHRPISREQLDRPAGPEHPAEALGGLGLRTRVGAVVEDRIAEQDQAFHRQRPALAVPIAPHRSGARLPAWNSAT